MNIAFVQLGSYGDNINSTMMLKPIKDAFPGCNIEVHTTDLYGSAFHNNPYVASIVEHHAANKTKCFDLYNTVPAAVAAQKYDKVFVPAPVLHPNRRNSLRHPEFGQNIITTFMRVLEDADIDYPWPVSTVLRLTNEEIDKARKWLSIGNRAMHPRKILMEVQGESGQTFWDPHWTRAVVRHLVSTKDTSVFISRRERTQEIKQLEVEYPHRVWWAGDLSLRECAEVYNNCGAFLGVSSGLGNVCNTDYCRKDTLWIEAMNSPTVNSAPLRSDGKVFWYANDVNAFINMLRERGL